MSLSTETRTLSLLVFGQFADLRPVLPLNTGVSLHDLCASQQHPGCPKHRSMRIWVLVKELNLSYHNRDL